MNTDLKTKIRRWKPIDRQCYGNIWIVFQVQNKFLDCSLFVTIASFELGIKRPSFIVAFRLLEL